jgi:RNA polymerase sigma factor (sigma-70 family)
MTHWNEHFRDLLRRMREGSEDAAWELVEQYGDAIRRAVRRTLSEKMRSQFDSLDFVQIVWKSFFRIREKSDRFDHPAQLAAYLLAIARNKVGIESRRLLHTGKYNVNRECSLDGEKTLVAHDVRDPGPAPMDVAIARERWDRLMRSQPDRYRQIARLKLQGHSCREIAQLLGIAECTVRRVLHKLLEELPV